MDTIQEDDIDDDLKDFITNFKFPWELEDNNHSDTNRNGGKFGIRRTDQRLSERVYFSDTTPARKGKRLSGKNLTKEYSITARHPCSPVTAEKVLDGQPVEVIDSTKSSELSGELNHKTTNPIKSEKEHEAKETDQFMGEVPSVSFVSDKNNHSLPTKKKKKRRQSSFLNRRESLALLKTIGEASSPYCNNNLEENSSSVQHSEENVIKCNYRSQSEAKKSKARTSRRRSSRLSGISHPMLELGTNGIPKLVQNQVSSQLESPLSEAPECTGDFQTPIQSEESCKKNETCSTFQNTERDLGYRHKYESPISPLQNSAFVADDVDPQFYTPQNQTICKVVTSTPGQSILSSLRSLHLQVQCPSDDIKEHDVDNCKMHSVGKTCEDISSQQISDEECDVPGTTKEIDTKPEEEGDEQIQQESFPDKCESLVEGCLDERRGPEVDISEWKENVNDSTNSMLSPTDHTLTSSTCFVEEMEVDPKVKEIYLKKGQMRPFKRTNTNLETVFEEQKTDVVSFGKRKYRRSLAFPEKPWVPRNSKRGAKQQKGRRKKRLSLSRTSKTNDVVLGERLDNILDSLVEDS